MQQEKAKEMKGSVMYVEGKALGSCFVIVEMLTDRPKRARHDVQYILKKFGYFVGFYCYLQLISYDHVSTP